MAKYALPVLMYHHVNPHVNNLVTISPQDFEAQMAYLASNGYQSLNMEEALPLLRAERSLSGKEVLITFDDGFLDNWVYAAPILHKHGMQAVIFVATAFVENEGPARPHLGQVWQERIGAGQLPEIKQHNDFDYQAIMCHKNGDFYLRWSELAQREAEGVIDVQSHGHFHGEYFSGEKIVGFNHNPHSRLALSTGSDSRPRIPVYDKKPALLGPRYYDDYRLRDYLAQYVQSHGGTNFFQRPEQEWQTQLQSLSDDYIRQHGVQGRYESAQEYEERVKQDLAVSKHLIESKLNKKCLALAWPWGAYNQQLLQWAQELGYAAIFTTERGSNQAGCDLLQLRRCVVKKGDLAWFARQLLIYSNPLLSRVYLQLRRKL